LCSGSFCDFGCGVFVDVDADCGGCADVDVDGADGRADDGAGDEKRGDFDGGFTPFVSRRGGAASTA
jgi:hypothetical protein